MKEENNFLGELWQDITKEHQTGEIRRPVEDLDMPNKLLTYLRAPQSKKLMLTTSDLDRYCAPLAQFQQKINETASQTDFDQPEASYELESVVTYYSQLKDSANEYVNYIKNELFNSEKITPNNTKQEDLEKKRSEAHAGFIALLCEVVSNLDKLPETNIELRDLFQKVIEKLEIIDLSLEEFANGLKFLLNCGGTSVFREMNNLEQISQLTSFNEVNQTQLTILMVSEIIRACHNLALILYYNNLERI